MIQKPQTKHPIDRLSRTSKDNLYSIIKKVMTLKKNQCVYMQFRDTEFLIVRKKDVMGKTLEEVN